MEPITSSSLGVLALLPEDRNVVIAAIMIADDFPSAQKGYRVFGFGRKQRVKHASMIVTGDYLGKPDAIHTTAISGALPLIVTQQADICAAIAAFDGSY